MGPRHRAPAYELKQETIAEPQVMRFDKVPLCNEAEEKISNVEDISVATLKDHIGACVRIEIPQDKSGLPLLIHGKYRNVYVQVPFKDETVELGLVMSRRWDTLPNIDDSRVDRSEVERGRRSSHFQKESSRSNKCYQRHVLEGKGGDLRFAEGRVGYFVNGYLSMVIPTRESKDLILENLPAKKRNACVW